MESGRRHKQRLRRGTERIGGLLHLLVIVYKWRPGHSRKQSDDTYGIMEQNPSRTDGFLESARGGPAKGSSLHHNERRNVVVLEGFILAADGAGLLKALLFESDIQTVD